MDTGNGVEVGIYLNEQFTNPVFESAISSDHTVDADDPFSGTGSVSFDELLQVQVGDRLTLAVFADSQGLDGFFDVTALRGQINPIPVPEPLAGLVVFSLSFSQFFSRRRESRLI